MYTIEITYKTGDSFGSHEETECIGLQWEDKALARKALHNIKEHYTLYQENESSWRRERTKEQILAEVIIKDWYVNASKCEYDLKYPSFHICSAQMDNGEWRNLPMFWIGYFEDLREAKVISVGDDEDVFTP